ncbi:MAG: hypothetical protein HYZ34_12685 [Ignavibacteriae bacterium]|nr:hypothetical protein [Ignavibacteriota bacterium]
MEEPEPKKMNWDWLMRINPILQLIAAIITIVMAIIVVLAVHRIEEGLFDVIRRQNASIYLNEQKDSAVVTNGFIYISGNITFSKTEEQFINVRMVERGMELVPFVKVLPLQDWWKAESSPVVLSNGNFHGSIVLKVIGSYQIVVIAAPKGFISVGADLINLPAYFGTSNVIHIQRMQ